MVGAFTFRTEAISRGARMLRTALGPAIAAWLEDPGVVEVMLNPDGRLWVDRLTEGLIDTGERLAAADGERIVRLVAHHVGAEVHSAAPRVSAELPETGERFEGLIPPVVAAPAFAIRKPAVAVFTLDDYVAAGIMSADEAGVLRRAVEKRRNIFVAGGTSTGKTTLVNALLAEPGGVANQGRRGLAVRSCTLLASAAARSHPDRRGARRRSARPLEGVGYRTSRRDRHHSCRVGSRRAAPPGAAHPGSSRHRTARPHRGDDRPDCRARRSRARATTCRARRDRSTRAERRLCPRIHSIRL